MRRCSRCREEKPLTKFYNNISSQCGYRSECKVCSNITKRIYRSKNKEKIAEYDKIYRADNKEKIDKQMKRYRIKNQVGDIEKRRIYYLENKEKIATKGKEYRLKNQDILKKKQIEYRKNNKEKIREKNVLWRTANPEKRKLQRKQNKLKRRATKMGVIIKVTQKELNELIKNSNNICFWCDEYTEMIHIDHIYPLSKSGGHTINNLCISCPPCNLRKSNKDPEVWLEEVLSGEIAL